MKKLLVATLMLLGAAACGPKNFLHETYGMKYNQLFPLQAGEHSSREVAPVRGGEARRVMQAYYKTLGGDENADSSAATSAAPMPMSMGAPPSLSIKTH